MNSLIDNDFELMLDEKNLFEVLRNKKIFLTGGTGFFGKWILFAIRFLNREMGLNAKVVVLSRDPQRFQRDNSALNENAEFIFQKGDIRDFEFEHLDIDYVIHAATEANAVLNFSNPSEVNSVIVGGLEHLLKYCKISRAKRMLFISSGAVYEDISSEHNISENSGLTNLVDDAYGYGKRVSEERCLEFIEDSTLEIMIARCFSFVGPYLPLDSTFAVGNFISNFILGQPINIKGDGMSQRSYLYTSDLIHWLLKILIKGKNGRSYNVGSDQSISIKELAKIVSQTFNHNLDVIVEDRDSIICAAGNVYVPNIDRITGELGVKVHVPLDEAIERTIRFNMGVLSK